MSAQTFGYLFLAGFGLLLLILLAAIVIAPGEVTYEEER